MTAVYTHTLSARIEAFIAFVLPLTPDARAKLNWPGVIWKDAEDNLHIDLKAFTAGEGRTCMCSISYDTDGLQGFAETLIELFGAKEVIIHDSFRPQCKSVLITVPKGTAQNVTELSGRIQGDDCATRVVIPGIVSWVMENKTGEYQD